MNARAAAGRQSYDAIVIGSGPNGLAAAIELARANLSVLVVEANDTIGGGARSLPLTLPGFVHDLCSAIHPMGVAAPYFPSLPLKEHGLEWIHPPVPVAHPLDDGSAALLFRSVEETADRLGADGKNYRRLFGPLTASADKLFEATLAPLGLPRHPWVMARFGLRAIRSARGLAESWFATREARALFAGIAGHAILPLEQMLTAAVGIMLALAGHAAGWPLPRGGAQKISDALAGYFQSLGGEIVTGCRVGSLDELPEQRVVLFDTSPRIVSAVCGAKLPAGFRKKLERFRHGPAVFKLDYALAGPIPWRAADVARAGTVHLGGTFDEIAHAERVIWQGEHPEWPYVLVAQQCNFDPSRAPPGQHTGWAYCHVPNGSTVDMTERIEAQLERFAPGFRDLVLERCVTGPADFEAKNANYIGGDITGGIMDAWQLFTRPTARLVPYSTPNPGIFLCSASTPPGPGVHGMCGYHAARAALRRLGVKR
ncbi:MAG: phytoene desaturase family protein [Gemmataceae bacterium]